MDDMNAQFKQMGLKYCLIELIAPQTYWCENIGDFQRHLPEIRAKKLLLPGMEQWYGKAMIFFPQTRFEFLGEEQELGRISDETGSLELTLDGYTFRQQNLKEGLVHHGKIYSPRIAYAPSLATLQLEHYENKGGPSREKRGVLLPQFARLVPSFS